MTNDLVAYAERFRRMNVLVLGEAILDSYLTGLATRICREAPVPVIDVTSRLDYPGGAANTAVNLAALGANVALVSVVGTDPEAGILERSLRDHGVGTGYLFRESGRRTLAKHRVMAGDQMVVRYDQGTTRAALPSVQARIIRALGELYPSVDAVLISDYSYGCISPRVLAALADLQARMPRIVVTDARDLKAYRDVGCTAVKPNFEEVQGLLGNRISEATRAQALGAKGNQVLKLTGARMAAVTLDRDGVLMFERGRMPYHSPARRVTNAAVAGAGDTFASALALSLAAGAGAFAAADIAMAAASVVVSKSGTACCALDELLDALRSDEKVLADTESLRVRADSHRRSGRRLVFTNGCFDILHPGHIGYLTGARAQGDILVVGVNDDASVSRLKGPERPVNGLEDRMRVLAALNCVDHVVPFSGDTPEDLIRAMRPDVFVKGGDYTEATLPEAPLVRSLGGRVEIMPFLEDRSTSRIIARIQSTGDHPATRRTGRGAHAARGNVGQGAERPLH